MTVAFTPAARRLLDTLPDDERARVGNWAKRIALGRGDDVAGIDDIRIAQRVAGPEFLPEPGEWESLPAIDTDDNL